MGRPDPKEVPENLIAFAKNVHACAEIVGRSIESVALRTAIDHRLFADYLNGKGYLSDEILEAVCAEFRLDASRMLVHFCSQEDRMAVLEQQLKSAGFITHSALLGAGPPSTAVPQLPEIQIEEPEEEDNADESVQPDMEEPMADEMVVEIVTSEVTIDWDEEDLVGVTSDGRHFNLRNNEARKAVIGRVRKLIDGTNMTFASLNELAKLKQPSSWWRNVETAKSRIYGTNVESLAAVLNVSVISLLTDPEPEDSSTLELAVAATPVDPLILVEPAVLLAEPSPQQVVAEVPVTESATVLMAVAAPTTDEQDYFRRLVLSASTEPAPNASFGQLLELARDQEGVDWKETYLTLTLAGH